MKKGVYTAHITDNGVREVFIEQDVLETEYLNKLTKRNIMAREAELQRREARRQQEAHQNMMMLYRIVIAGCMILSFLLGHQLG
jgi:hypothetical protein